MPEYARIRDLAARMREVGAENDSFRLPLLLGSGCAEAAGVPTDAEIARKMILRLTAGATTGRTLEARRSVVPPPQADSDDDTVLGWFRAYLASLGPTQRYKVIEPHYRAVPVPSFYHDLARLAQTGWMTHILTTNVDTLLEQALDRAGLRRGTDYEVIVLGTARRELQVGKPRLRVVKLHGDLGLTQLPPGPQEIEQALSEQRSLFRGQLLDELIVVGHELSADRMPLDEWLWRSSGRELWWALPKVPPATSLLADLSAIRPVWMLAGEDRGTPESFFARLSFLLLQVPALEVLKVLGPDGQDLEEAFWHSEMLKTRAMTHDLQEQLVPGIPDEAVNAELAQQYRKSVPPFPATEPDLPATGVGQPQKVLADAVELIVRETSAVSDNSLANYLSLQARLMLNQARTQPVDSPIMRVAASGVLALTDAMGPDLSPTAHARIREAVEVWGGRPGPVARGA